MLTKIRQRLSALLSRRTDEPSPRWTSGSSPSRRSVATISPNSGLTDDPLDPRLVTGARPQGQNDVYLVLPEEERAQGFVRNLYRSYRHLACGHTTTMGQALAETYARNPHFYGATYCAHCGTHFPVGEHGQFIWVSSTGRVIELDGKPMKVGT